MKTEDSPSRKRARTTTWASPSPTTRSGR